MKMTIVFKVMDCKNGKHAFLCKHNETTLTKVIVTSTNYPIGAEITIPKHAVFDYKPFFERSK